MRIVRFTKNGKEGLGLIQANDAIAVRWEDEGFGAAAFLKALGMGPSGLAAFAAELGKGITLRLDDVSLSTPVPLTGKILCLGANFGEHASEANFAHSKHPAVFLRVHDSFVAPGESLVKPKLSDDFDFEGELAVVVGSRGRHIPPDRALEHVAGYSILQDGSIRDYQLNAAQWTLGKNFYRSGSLGPAFVAAQGLPPGCKGLRLQTRLNGAVVQDASLSEMLIDVASAVSILSGVMSLEPGDVIAMGTPAGVGLFRKPPLFMKAGDVCEIDIEGLGTLRNGVVDEA
jgi:acylpyruvate hydrolase